MFKHVVALSCLSISAFLGAGCAAEAEDSDEAGTSEEEIRGPVYPADAHSEVVTIDVSRSVRDKCTGVLVAARYVLTNKQCLREGSTYTVRAPYAGNQPIAALPMKAFNAGLDAFIEKDGGRPVNDTTAGVAVLGLERGITGVTYAKLPTFRASTPSDVFVVSRAQGVGQYTGKLFRSQALTLYSGHRANTFGITSSYVTREDVGAPVYRTTPGREVVAIATENRLSSSHVLVSTHHVSQYLAHLRASGQPAPF